MWNGVLLLNVLIFNPRAVKIIKGWSCIVVTNVSHVDFHPVFWWITLLKMCILFFIDTDLHCTLVLVDVNMFQLSIFWFQLGLGKLHTGADSHPAATEWPGENILLLLCVHCCAQVLLLPGPPPNRTHQDSGHPGLQLSRWFVGGILSHPPPPPPPPPFFYEGFVNWFVWGL